MKNKSALIGIFAIIVCTWVAAVTSYAAQVKTDTSKAPLPMDFCPCQCSSSGASGGGAE